MRSGGITIVKLGGSLANSKYLAGWLSALAGCGGRAIIVPGGGPFADAVRAAQAQMGFGDDAAHQLALLAMAQYGEALVSLAPDLRMAASAPAIRRVLREGRVPVWSPAAMVSRRPEIPASWDITSDSLAAWLAGKMHARRLVLVKHCGRTLGPLRATDLVAGGLVDHAFPSFLAASGVKAFMVAPHEHTGLAAAVRSDGQVGIRIDLRHPDPKRLHSSPWPRSTRRVGVGL
jgi:5-(aminomethyl)-3-furanmethanol phosphate kinase